MNDRKITMARFEEPDDEPEVLAECENCGAELYDGCDVYKTDDDKIFCCVDCALEYFGIYFRTLEKESDF